MAKRLTITDLADKLRTEADAYKFLEDLRWNGEPVCPHCGSVEQHYFLTPKDGSTRKTRTGSESQRRVWKCRSCRKQFSVLTGTIFHGTKVPVRTWVFVVFEMASSKNGVAAKEIERKYGLAPKTAWFMMHRIREAMKREPMAGLLTGRVVVDETYIGGKPSNRHGHKRGHGGQGKTDKTPVMALVSHETGEIVTKVVPNVTGGNLAAALRGEVDVERVVLHTDEGAHYKTLPLREGQHFTVNHSAGEYVRGDVSTNQAENFFSQLKRSIDGTHHHVSVPHLDRYLAEFSFRYSYRTESDADRMARLVGQSGGKRLTYRQPTSGSGSV
jgi:transposase-like protein